MKPGEVNETSGVPVESRVMQKTINNTRNTDSNGAMYVDREVEKEGPQNFDDVILNVKEPLDNILNSAGQKIEETIDFE